MLTTTGLPAFCAAFTACRIWSLAVTEPPGESTRSTMALMFLSRAAWPIAADRSSLAMPAQVLSSEFLAVPSRISPAASTMAILAAPKCCDRVLHIVGELDRLGAGSGAGVGGGARLVVIADAVHQPGGCAHPRRIAGWPPAPRSLRRVVMWRLAAIWLDRAVIDRLHQRRELLAVGRRHLLFHVHVGGAFVFGALGDLGHGLDLVQECRAGKSRRRRRPTRENGALGCTQISLAALAAR